MKKFSKLQLFILSFIIGLIYLPSAIAETVNKNNSFFLTADITKNHSSDSSINSSLVISVYDSLNLSESGLNQQVFTYAKQGFQHLINAGTLLNDSIITIIDFSLSSSEKRLFVLDMKNYHLLFTSIVAHGRNTGQEFATQFSNANSSFKSSPGFYKTAETYYGKNGFSLKLEGLENGINNNAYSRGIVMHGASYVSASFINSQGYIGRSQGCPAVPQTLNKPIINTIKNGTCLFVYHPTYINQSVILN